uniref:transposase n=1 Tax=Acetatifactor sp. TaxID=1872090 RepID=UPI004056AA27
MEKQVKRRLSDNEKIQLVKDFFVAHTTKAAFAEQHNIDRKALTRWIKKFEFIAQKELSKQEITETIENEMMVSIPYFEYLELLKIKHKYDVMHSVIDA